MSGAFAYSGLTTKTKAMQGKLISDEDYITIANLGSVTEVIQYLTEHPAYANILPENSDESFYHRGVLEHHLTLSLYSDFAKIYNFSTLSQRKYLQLYFMNYETRFLKQLFRELTNNRQITSDFKALKIYYDNFSSINFDKVINSNSIDELIENLKNTKYYDVLNKISAIESPTLFDYEICLDIYKYTVFWKKKDKYLSGTDLKVTTAAYGYNIDLLNIQWIYRCHEYYHMTASQIYSLIIPFSYHFKFPQLKAMVEAENTNDFLDALSKTYYEDFTNEIDSSSIEKYLDKMISKQYDKVFRNNPYSLACVNAYLHKREVEIKKIITITECIRYSYSSDTILQMI